MIAVPTAIISSAFMKMIIEKKHKGKSHADTDDTPAGQQKKVPPSPATEKAGPDENDRCKRILSTVGYRCIIYLIQHVLVRRTDDAASFEIQFFDAVSRPTYDTSHSKQRCIDFLRQSHQFIDEA